MKLEMCKLLSELFILLLRVENIELGVCMIFSEIGGAFLKT